MQVGSLQHSLQFACILHMVSTLCFCSCGKVVWRRRKHTGIGSIEDACAPAGQARQAMQHASMMKACQPQNVCNVLVLHLLSVRMVQTSDLSK